MDEYYPQPLLIQKRAFILALATSKIKTFTFREVRKQENQVYYFYGVYVARKVRSLS